MSIFETSCFCGLALMHVAPRSPAKKIMGPLKVVVFMGLIAWGEEHFLCFLLKKNLFQGCFCQKAFFFQTRFLSALMKHITDYYGNGIQSNPVAKILRNITEYYGIGIFIYYGILRNITVRNTETPVHCV